MLAGIAEGLGHADAPVAIGIGGHGQSPLVVAGHGAGPVVDELVVGPFGTAPRQLAGPAGRHHHAALALQRLGEGSGIARPQHHGHRAGLHRAEQRRQLCGQQPLAAPQPEEGLATLVELGMVHHKQQQLVGGGEAAGQPLESVSKVLACAGKVQVGLSVAVEVGG